ncbi:hypothetical protein N2152v2_003391 [Parachlorella kessleri]
MPTINSFRAADYAVLGVAGAGIAFALFGAWFTIPWRRRSRRAEITREFNILWQGRATLELFCALWVASQLLRVSSVWGANSFIFPDLVTDWTGAGWFCRIYLTAALGFFQPFCSLLALLMLTGVTRRKMPLAEAAEGGGNSSSSSSTSGVIAWLGLIIKPGGFHPEDRPRSVLGYFFASFWRGDVQQCGGDEGCTLCTFPAAAVIAQGLFSAAYLVVLWVTSSRMAAAVLNKRLKRRLRFFQWAYSVLPVAGVGALGGSIVTGPFSWVNQGCWLGYFASVVATVALLSWELVIWPVHDLRRVNKRLKLWTNPSDNLADSPEDGGYIKAVPRQQSLGVVREERGSAGDMASQGSVEQQDFVPAPMAASPPTLH